MRRRRVRTGVTAVLTTVALTAGGLVRAQNAPSPTQGQGQAQAKAAQVETRGGDAQTAAPSAAVQWLASSVALYPDPVLEKVLEAAQRPAAVTQAAKLLAAPGGFDPGNAKLPRSVADLAQTNPNTIKELAARPGLTGRLGREFRDDPKAVWDAIERAREQIEARKDKAQTDDPDAATPDEAGSVANTLDVATPEAQDELCNDEIATPEQADAAASTPLPAPSTPVVAGGTTVVPGRTTVVPGATTVVGGPGSYAGGFISDGVGGYVRRGWYGHNAFFAGGYGYGGRGGYGYGGNTFNREVNNNFNRRPVNPNNHGIGPDHHRLYDHDDANRTAAADRALHRNFNGLHHGSDEHNAAHHAGEHHSSHSHHGEHHHHSSHHSGGGKKK